MSGHTTQYAICKIKQSESQAGASNFSFTERNQQIYCAVALNHNNSPL